MKKFAIVIIMILALTFTLVGCDLGGNKNNTPTYPQEYKKTGGTKAIIIVPGICASGMYLTEEVEDPDDPDQTITVKRPIWDPLTIDDVDMLEFLGTYLEEGEEFNPLTLNTVQAVMSDWNELQAVLKLASDMFLCKEGNLFDLIGSDEDGKAKYDVKGIDWFDPEFPGHARNGALNACKQLIEGVQELVGDEYEVVMYNYNFTQDNREAVEGLTKLMNDHNYTESIIIAHSMGGLVTTGYLAASADNRARIDKFISLGAPYYGSFMAAEIYEDPYSWKQLLLDMLGEYEDMVPSMFSSVYDMVVENLDTMFDEVVVPTLYNMTSVAQLLPTGDMLDLFEANGQVAVKVDGQVLSGDELYNWYCTRKWAKNSSNAVRKSMVDLPSYRDSLYADTADGRVFGADLVDTYYVAGNNVATTNGIEITDNGVVSTTTMAGDGIVSLLSATRGKAEDGEHVFYLDGWGHIPLGCYWNEELIEVITQIIKPGNQE